MTRWYVCAMTRWYMCHDSLICVTWLVDMCDVTQQQAVGVAEHQLLICFLLMWHDSLICMCHDSLMSVTWLIDTCDMTKQHVVCVAEHQLRIRYLSMCHDSLICVPWLVDLLICVPWLVDLCAKTCLFMRRDSTASGTCCRTSAADSLPMNHDSRMRWLLKKNVGEKKDVTWIADMCHMIAEWEDSSKTNVEKKT